MRAVLAELHARAHMTMELSMLTCLNPCFNTAAYTFTHICQNMNVCTKGCRVTYRRFNLVALM